MSTHVRSSAVARTAYVAGVAAAGAAFWMAGTTGPDVAEPEVQLASIGSPMLSPMAADCPTVLCTNFIGSNASPPTPAPLFAALIGPSAAPSIASTGMDPISAFISIFVSNGTAERPNAGLLIGNGYQGAAGRERWQRRTALRLGRSGRRRSSRSQRRNRRKRRQRRTIR